MKTKNNKRQTIMEAAEKLFASRRFHEITMDDIAAAAGVAKGTLYGYFKDKDDLFFQTGTSGFDELCELIARKVCDEMPFPQQLLSACREISTFYKQRHQLLRMMQAEDGRMSQYKGSLRQRWMDKRKNLLMAIAGILAKGVASKEIRSDIPPFVMASMLMGMMRARAIDLTDSPAELRSHEVILELFCTGASHQCETTSPIQIQDDATAGLSKRSIL